MNTDNKQTTVSGDQNAGRVVHHDSFLGKTGDTVVRREVVCVGWDGQSKPILRYRDELDLPEHQQTRVPAPARKKRETVREWKDRMEVNDRRNLRKYQEILDNANFILANSTDERLREYAQVIINISQRA